MVTEIVREMTERSLGRGNHMNNENHVNPVMTGLGRESERGTEEIARRRKRGNGRGQGIGRSQRKVIEEVEVETDHLTDERAGSPDILRIVPQRLVDRLNHVVQPLCYFIDYLFNSLHFYKHVAFKFLCNIDYISMDANLMWF